MADIHGRVKEDLDFAYVAGSEYMSRFNPKVCPNTDMYHGLLHNYVTNYLAHLDHLQHLEVHNEDQPWD